VGINGNLMENSNVEEVLRNEKNVSSSEYFEEDHQKPTLKVEEEERTEMNNIPEDENLTIKSKSINENSEYFEVDDVRAPKVENVLEANEELDATYICPLDSCTFFTKIMNNDLLTDHFKSCHDGIDPHKKI